MSCPTQFPTRSRLRSTIAAIALGSLLLTNCAASQMPGASSEAEAPDSVAALSPDAGSIPASAPADPTAAADMVAAPVPTRPQLAKTAELLLTVETMEQSLDQVTAIARQYEGDVLVLQDQTPPNEYSRHTAYMQLRVPQAQLDATLEAIAELGTVQRQAIQAEDVSTQLVDFQARLRTLRRTENLLLEIMERSGEMGEVLQVAQELSTVRTSIEQIDAQLTAVQNRVAYSTINLSLEEAIATTTPTRPVSVQLQETWESATRSLGKVTVDLVQLLIWLLVYSPYWLLLVGGVLGFKYLYHRRRTVEPSSESST